VIEVESGEHAHPTGQLVSRLNVPDAFDGFARPVKTTEPYAPPFNTTDAPAPIFGDTTGSASGVRKASDAECAMFWPPPVDVAVKLTEALVENVEGAAKLTVTFCDWPPASVNEFGLVAHDGSVQTLVAENTRPTCPVFDTVNVADPALLRGMLAD
jgi:hypothetical protein